jgi:hypothetical protein
VPYPPCTPAAHYARAGRGVTVFRLKYRDPARCCRQVTQPPHIAGPLAHIFESEGLSPRTALIKFYLDNINSILLPGLAIARQTFSLVPSSETSVIILTLQVSTGTWPLRDGKHVLTAKSKTKIYPIENESLC